MNDYQKMQIAKNQAIQNQIDKAPKCGDCGRKKSYMPSVYGAYRCTPCYDQEDEYHGTECYCGRCMGE